jgi:hypothetical protein
MKLTVSDIARKMLIEKRINSIGYDDIHLIQEIYKECVSRKIMKNSGGDMVSRVLSCFEDSVIFEKVTDSHKRRLFRLTRQENTFNKEKQL